MAATEQTPAAAAQVPPPTATVPASPAAKETATPAKAPQEYGKVPREVTKSLFDKLDAQAEGKESTNEPTDEPEAKAKPEGEPEAKPGEKPTEKTAAQSKEELLPPRIREALKEIKDPKIKEAIADRYYVAQRIGRLQSEFGLKLPEFEAVVRKSMEIAPTVEALDEMGRTATVAQKLFNGYAEGSKQGFDDFIEGMLVYNPGSFVRLSGYLRENGEDIRDRIAAKYGREAANDYEDGRVADFDIAQANVVERMRKTAAKAKEKGDAEGEVWAEVADHIEKFLNLKERMKKPVESDDPRDRELREVRQREKERKEREHEGFKTTYHDHVGNALAQDITRLVNQRAAGYPPKLRTDITVAIARNIFTELLENETIQTRVKTLESAGAYEQVGPQIVNYLTTKGRRMLTGAADRVLQDVRERYSPVETKHNERIERHVAQRPDAGAAGSLASPKPVNLGALKTNKDRFDALDAEARERGSGF